MILQKGLENNAVKDGCPSLTPQTIGINGLLKMTKNSLRCRRNLALNGIR
jgi:hypothetical protein